MIVTVEYLAACCALETGNGRWECTRHDLPLPVSHALVFGLIVKNTSSRHLGRVLRPRTWCRPAVTYDRRFSRDRLLTRLSAGCHRLD